MSQLAQLLPLVGIALIFWLLIIRPAQRRQKALAGMQAALSVGDEVMLTSGIHATVRSLDGETVAAEIAPDVRVRVARGAIGSVISPVADPEDDVESDPDGRGRATPTAEEG